MHSLGQPGTTIIDAHGTGWVNKDGKIGIPDAIKGEQRANLEKTYGPFFMGNELDTTGGRINVGWQVASVEITLDKGKLVAVPDTFAAQFGGFMVKKGQAAMDKIVAGLHEKGLEIQSLGVDPQGRIALTTRSIPK